MNFSLDYDKNEEEESENDSDENEEPEESGDVEDDGAMAKEQELHDVNPTLTREDFAVVQFQSVRNA